MPIQIGDMTLYTVKDLSKLLSVSESTIRAYIADGRLKGKKIARRWFVPDTSVQAYFADLLDEEEPAAAPAPATEEHEADPSPLPGGPVAESEPDDDRGSEMERLLREAERLKREAARVEKLYKDDRPDGA